MQYLSPEVKELQINRAKHHYCNEHPVDILRAWPLLRALLGTL
jgi:hypothetical protein